MREPSHWTVAAKRAIQEVDAALPEDAPLAERTKAIDAAYPFGPRSHLPYKMWLQARREYLGRFGYRKRGLTLSPMERMMLKAKD